VLRYRSAKILRSDVTSAVGGSTLSDSEVRFMVALQARANRPPVIRAARALGAVGEHASLWQMIAVGGAIVDGRRRRQWLEALVGIIGAHATAVLVKRVVRRPRPTAVGLQLLVPTMSGLSFPSSHSASTTAAALSLGRLFGLPLAPVLPSAMGAARVVVGAHYPSDVVGGALIGWLVDRSMQRWRG